MMTRVHVASAVSVLACMMMFAGPATADGTCELTCPANVFVATAPGAESAPVSFQVLSAGTCGSISQTSGILSGGSFFVGTTTNSFRANDSPNQTCSFTVTVTATPAVIPAAAVPSLGASALGLLSLMLAAAGLFLTRRPTKS
jgi:hypothetical protein